MEDVNQRTQNQAAYLEINGNLKRNDKSNILTISGNSDVEFVAVSESDESEFSEDGDSDIIRFLKWFGQNIQQY